MLRITANSQSLFPEALFLQEVSHPRPLLLGNRGQHLVCRVEVPAKIYLTYRASYKLANFPRKLIFEVMLLSS